MIDEQIKKEFIEFIKLLKPAIMRTIKINAYKLSELPEEIQEKRIRI